MSQQQSFKNKRIEIHKYDRHIKSTYSTMRQEFSEENFEMIEKYDKELVRFSIAKSTRLTHLKTLQSITRLLNKDWKDDGDEVIFEHYGMPRAKKMDL